MKRIRRLFYPKPNGTLAPFLAAAILIATAAVSFAAWQTNLHHEVAAVVQSKSEAEKVLPPAYFKWVKGPVSFIITSQEQTAFLRLTSNEERDQFIKQFWKRRNPHPGSHENEFKTEFYRRVSYANEHFAASGIPGWKTDRGRAYITWGPPDEIERHESGGIYVAPIHAIRPKATLGQSAFNLCRAATSTIAQPARIGALK